MAAPGLFVGGALAALGVRWPFEMQHYSQRFVFLALWTALYGCGTAASADGPSSGVDGPATAIPFSSLATDLGVSELCDPADPRSGPAPPASPPQMAAELPPAPMNFVLEDFLDGERFRRKHDGLGSTEEALNEMVHSIDRRERRDLSDQFGAVSVFYGTGYL